MLRVPLKSNAIRYLLALLFVGFALLISDLIHPLIPHAVDYLFLAAVIASAWLGGRGPGLFAAFVAALVLDYCFLPQLHTLGISREAWPYLVPFLLSAVAGAWMSATRSAAKEAKERLASIVESSDDAIIGKTLDGTIVSWNRGAERLYGYCANDVLGKSISVLASPKRVDEIPQILARIGRGESVAHLETVRLRKDGTAVDVSVTVSPVRNTRGEIIGASTVARDITERKRAERELLYKTALLEAQSETTIDGVLVVDDAGRIVLSNRRFASMFNIPEQLLNVKADAPVLECVVSQVVDRAKFSERVQYLYAHPDEKSRDEVPLRDGRTLDRFSSPLIVSDGHYRGRIWYFRDLTDRKRVEEELRKLSQAVEHSPASVMITDASGSIEYVNPQFTRLTGYSLEEVLGKNPRILRSGLTPATTYHELWTTVVSGQEWRGELINKKRNGEHYWGFVAISPLKDANGAISHFIAVKQDISKQKWAEESLRESESRFRRLTESNIVGVFVGDDSGRILEANSKFLTMFGYTLEDLNEGGVRWDLMTPPEFAHIKVRIYQDLTSKGVCAPLELEYLCKDGSRVPVMTGLASLDSSRKRAIALVVDLSVRKQAEAEMRKAKEAAEAANSAKSQFLANMSHEIRTPMNGVIGMSGLLLDTDLTPEQRRYAEIVRTSGEALLGIINDILDFSKIEARKLSLEAVDFDLSLILEEAASVLAVKASEKGLELTYELHPATPRLLRGDPGRLRQVLLNLLANAVKFTTQGEVAVRVELETEDEHTATLRFSVRDTGIGFRQEKAAQLFEPFVQADGSRTRRYGGTGLGLTISKQLVEMMGGHISAQSAEATGSTFYFTALFEKQARQRPLPASLPAFLRGARILVVDDNATNCALVCGLLAAGGGRPEGLTAASRTVSVLGEASQSHFPFQLVLLDASLPDAKAEELARQITTDASLPKTPILLMTDVNRFLGAERLQQLGCAGQVTKPIGERKLRQALYSIPPKGKEAPAIAGTVLGVQVMGQAQGGRILVAEDNVTNQQVIEAFLTKLGFAADIVVNGVEVILALRNGDYDAVLMDCEMPEMDGYEATRRIRDREAGVRNAKIAIIALTADAISGDRERCLEAGMSDYLAKPLDLRQLAAVLKKWVGEHTEDFRSPEAPYPKQKSPPTTD